MHLARRCLTEENCFCDAYACLLINHVSLLGRNIVWPIGGMTHTARGNRDELRSVEDSPETEIKQAFQHRAVSFVRMGVGAYPPSSGQVDPQIYGPDFSPLPSTHADAKAGLSGGLRQEKFSGTSVTGASL
jgi:hypothetical protein